MSLVLLLAVVAAAAAAVVAVGRRRGSSAPAAVVALVPVGVIWVLGLALTFQGWKDIDGWVDCGDHCHGWHRLGAILFWGPPLLALVLVAIAIVAAVGRRRPE